MHSNRRFAIAAFLTAFHVLLLTRGTDSVALAADNDPSLADAVQQQTSQAEEFRRQTEAREAEPPAQSPLAPAEAESEKATGPDAGPRFQVSKILFEGNTVFPSSDFDPYVKIHEGETVSLEDLKLAAKAVTLHYRARGYLTSRAYIKPQKIVNGVVTIQVLEGRLDKTVVEGNRYFSTKFFEEAAAMPKDKPFRYSELERRLRFVNRNPDFHIAAVLAPGQTPETSDLHLKIDDGLPMHAYYEFNNRGSKLTHRSRHMVTGVHNNFLGKADSLSVTGSIAEEDAFRALSASWSLPMWQTGTTFMMSGSYVDSRLVKHLKPLDIEGLYTSVTPAISQELVITQKDQLSWYAGLEIKDSKSTISDTKTSLDRMRVLVTGPRWTHLGGGGRTSLSGDVHWGIPGLLGGSEAEDLNASRNGSGGDFIYYTGSASRIQRLPLGLTGVLRGEGQWTDDTLTAVELMRLGGYSGVRGYPESDSQGDYGFMGTMELVAPTPLPDSIKFPFTKDPFSKSVDWLVFFDGGKVFAQERGARTDVKDRMLLGIGGGLRVHLKQNISAQLDYGWPVGDDSTDTDNQPQAHFSIRVGL